MNTEFETTGLEREEGSEAYLTRDIFEKISLPETLPLFQGEGETSFSQKYDQDKVEYLKTLGVEVPEEWKKDRAMLVNTFIVSGLIVVLEGVRRDDQEIFEDVLKEKNRQLKEARIDKYGYRRRLSNGLLVEDYHRILGFSANPQKMVSEEELKTILSYIVGQLGADRE